MLPSVHALCLHFLLKMLFLGFSVPAVMPTCQDGNIGFWNCRTKINYFFFLKKASCDAKNKSKTLRCPQE